MTGFRAAASSRSATAFSFIILSSVRERPIAGVAAPEEPEIVEPGLVGPKENDVAGLSRF